MPSGVPAQRQVGEAWQNYSGSPTIRPLMEKHFASRPVRDLYDGDVKQEIHSKLITSSAKKVLSPFGLFQKGRSRTWLSDQNWWMVVVEFQPSSSSRGSYLNVGCMWLWNVKPYISFDVGYRVEEFCPFRNEEDFAIVAENLATQALQKTTHYRRLFATIGQVSDYYVSHAPDSFWPCFDAAVSHILAGQPGLATQLLAECVHESDDDPLWLTEGRSRAKELLTALNEPDRVRDIITKHVHETRKTA